MSRIELTSWLAAEISEVEVLHAWGAWVVLSGRFSPPSMGPGGKEKQNGEGGLEVVLGGSKNL